MKKIAILTFTVLAFVGCQKESFLDSDLQVKELNSANSTKQSVKLTRPIASNLQSDPDPNPTTPFGGAVFYGTLTHLGKVHGKTVNTSFTPISATEIAITSEDITYAANGDELWTRGSIVLHAPTDGSAIATITGGSTIVGGTGRFAGATGYFVYQNMVYNMVTGHESHTAYGEITY